MYLPITDRQTYNEYCNKLEWLCMSTDIANQDEIDELTALIEQYDQEREDYGITNPPVQETGTKYIIDTQENRIYKQRSGGDVEDITQENP